MECTARQSDHQRCGGGCDGHQRVEGRPRALCVVRDSAAELVVHVIVVLTVLRMARMIDPRLIVMSIVMSVLMSILMSVLMSVLMSALMSALVRTHLMINRSHMPHMKRALPTVRPPQRTA